MLTSSRIVSPVSTPTAQVRHRKPTHSNHSCTRMVWSYINTFSQSISSFLYFTGHTHIDILKVDLEGWEFDTLTTFLLPGPEFTEERPRIPPVSQILLELHLWNRGFSDLLNWWSTLERAGLRAVAREPNLVYQNYNRMQGSELAEVRPLQHFQFPWMTLLIIDLVVYIPERRGVECIHFG